mgnify:CR=1 FL=1
MSSTNETYNRLLEIMKMRDSKKALADLLEEFEIIWNAQQRLKKRNLSLTIVNKKIMSILITDQEEQLIEALGMGAMKKISEKTPAEELAWVKKKARKKAWTIKGIVTRHANMEATTAMRAEARKESNHEKSMECIGEGEDMACNKSNKRAYQSTAS